MGRMKVGALAGLILGVLDGASAWLSPAARPTFSVIVLIASVKGLATGLIVGWLAMRIERAGAVIALGGLVGATLSLAAAIPSGAYLEVVGPGLVIGILVGALVARMSAPSRASGPAQ